MITIPLPLHIKRHALDLAYKAPLFFSRNIEKLDGAWGQGYNIHTIRTGMYTDYPFTL